MLEVDSQTLFYTGFALLGALVLRAVIIARNDPLRHVPGPWYYHFPLTAGPAGLLFALSSKQKLISQHVHHLHESYGSSIVRMGASEVSVLSLDSFSAVHGMGRPYFTKTRLHAETNFAGAPNLFSELDRRVHAGRRKLFSRAFSAANLQENWGDEVRTKAVEAVALIRREAGAGRADVLKLWRLFTADVVSLLSFGESFGGLGNEARVDDHVNDAPNQDDFLAALEDWSIKVGIGIADARIMPLLLRLVALVSPRAATIVQSEDKICTRAHAAVKTLRHARDRGSVGDDHGRKRQNLFTNALLAHETTDRVGDGKSAALADADIRSEAAIFIFAGTDTTSTTLTYLVWAVLQRPALQARLEAECLALEPGFTNVDVLASCPVLEACLHETLRLYGPANVPLPRRVPAEGAVLEGKFVPGGTDVRTNTWSLHRMPIIWGPDPDTFDETRWMDGKVTDAMKKAWNPFGSGTRSCIGVHLAWMEMRLAGALFFRECRGARMVEGWDDRNMDQVLYFVQKPAGGKCEIMIPAGNAGRE